MRTIALVSALAITLTSALTIAGTTKPRPLQLKNFVVTFRLGNAPTITLVQYDYPNPPIKAEVEDADNLPTIKAKTEDKHHLPVMTATLEKLRAYILSGEEIIVCVDGETIKQDHLCGKDFFKGSPEKTKPSSAYPKPTEALAAKMIRIAVDTENEVFRIGINPNANRLHPQKSLSFKRNSDKAYLVEAIDKLLTVYPGSESLTFCIDPSVLPEKLVPTFDCE